MNESLITSVRETHHACYVNVLKVALQNRERRLDRFSYRNAQYEILVQHVVYYERHEELMCGILCDVVPRACGKIGLG